MPATKPTKTVPESKPRRKTKTEPKPATPPAKRGPKPFKIVDDLESPPKEIKLSELQRLAGLGFNTEQIARIMGMSDRTLDNYLQKHEDVRKAWETGKLRSLAKVAQCAFDMAMAGDTTMIIFICKTQLGWSEKAMEKAETAQAVQIYLPQTLTETQWQAIHGNQNGKTATAPDLS